MILPLAVKLSKQADSLISQCRVNYEARCDLKYKIIAKERMANVK